MLSLLRACSLSDEEIFFFVALILGCHLLASSKEFHDTSLVPLICNFRYSRLLDYFGSARSIQLIILRVVVESLGLREGRNVA